MGNPVRLTLERSVTVRNIDGLHANLLAMLSQQCPVVIDCSALEETDLSLIQLLVAARRSAQQSGRSLALAGPAMGALQVALRQGGFLSGADGDAFWGEPIAEALIA